MTTFAILPAAGKSSRMGRPKLALPVGGRTVLERVVQALHEGGIDSVLVVLGPHVAELAALVAAPGATTLLLEAETADMRATVEAGLGWLERHCRPKPVDFWLLVPADHPTLDAATIQTLLRAGAEAEQAAVIVPTFQGKRGHPTLIRWRLAAGLKALPPGLGINTYLRQFRSITVEVPLDNADVLLDLDTPGDYERLRHLSP